MPKRKPKPQTQVSQMLAAFTSLKALYIGLPSIAAFIVAFITILHYLGPVEAVAQGPSPPWDSKEDVDSRLAQLTQQQYRSQQKNEKAIEEIGNTSNWLLRQAQQQGWDKAMGDLNVADGELAKHPTNTLAKIDHNNAVTQLRTLAPLLGYQLPPGAVMLP